MGMSSHGATVIAEARPCEYAVFDRNGVYVAGGLSVSDASRWKKWLDSGPWAVDTRGRPRKRGLNRTRPIPHFERAKL